MDTTKKTYDFTGQITTLEPLTVSLKGVSTAKQHKMPRNGQELAYFPASSIRGALRSASHKMINELVKKQGDSFSIADHFMLSQGYVVNQVDADKLKKEAGATTTPVDAGEQIRQVNPFISIFGRWGLAGKLMTSNALSKSANDVQNFEQGARGIMFERSPELLDDLSENDVDRYFKIMENESLAAKDVAELKKQQMELKKELKHADGDTKDLIFGKLNALDQQIKDRKLEKGEAVDSIRRPLESIEAITANAQLTHRMSIKGGTTLELGLLIASLAAFARNPQLGGNAKHNYGKVNCHWDVKTWISDSCLQKTKIGSVTINEDGIEIVDATDDKVLTNAFNEWLNAQDLNLDFKRYI